MSRRHVIAECTELKTVDTEQYPGGTLEGYASVFNNIDDGGDIVVPGAFSKTINEAVPAKRVKLVDSHRMSQTAGVIGLVTSATEDEYGLKFNAFFSMDPDAQRIRQKIKEGILDALSFGYDTIKAESDRLTGARLLKELRLWEISVVNWGMNPKAHITGYKSLTEAAPSVLRHDLTWDPVAALARVQQWVGKGRPMEEWNDLDWQRYAAVFAKRSQVLSPEGLDYLIGDVVDGQLYIIPKACQDAHAKMTTSTASDTGLYLEKLVEFCKTNEITIDTSKGPEEVDKYVENLLAEMKMAALLRNMRSFADAKR